MCYYVVCSMYYYVVLCCASRSLDIYTATDLYQYQYLYLYLETESLGPFLRIKKPSFVVAQ